MARWDSELDELTRLDTPKPRRQKGNEQRLPGRPARNPFEDCPDVETELYAKAQRVVEQCYRPSEENKKKPFLLQPSGLPELRLGCTAFWALLYIYYRETFGIDNLDYFVDHLQVCLPDIRMVGDRSTVQKNISKYDCEYVHLSASAVDYTKNVDQVRHRRFRKAYLYVTNVWEEA